MVPPLTLPLTFVPFHTNLVELLQLQTPWLQYKLNGLAATFLIIFFLIMSFHIMYFVMSWQLANIKHKNINPSCNSIPALSIQEAALAMTV